MKPKRKKIARLRFKGERYDHRALDAAALREVERFLRLLEETAKAVWKQNDPEGRERLPTGFEGKNQAFMCGLRSGSTSVDIESRVEDTGQEEFLDRGAETMIIAADVAHEVFEAVNYIDRPLPGCLPRELISEYAKLGKSLEPGDFLEIKSVTRRRYVSFRAEDRERIQRFALQPYEDYTEQEGEIVEADVRKGKFQIWTKRGVAIPASFKPEQEEIVTRALKDHQLLRVVVSGRVEYSPEGKPIRFIEVDRLSVRSIQDEYLFSKDAPAIEDELAAIWNDVPDEEWKKLPSDLSRNLDHYLYGTPKE